MALLRLDGANFSELNSREDNEDLRRWDPIL